MKRTLLALALVASSTVALATPVATVDGQTIDSSVIDAQVKSLSAQYKDFKDTPELRTQLIAKAAQDRAILMLAQKAGVQNTEDYKTAIKNTEEQLSYNLYLKQLQGEAKKSVTEAEIKAFYEKFAKQPKPEQAKVRHVLVADEATANKYFKLVKAGKTTIKSLAEKHTLDTATKKTGGLIDYVNIDVFVPEFADAVKSIKKGLVKKPVKTKFGYHIIYVLGKRAQPTPKLDDQVKEEIKRLLTQQKAEKLLKDALNTIKVEFTK